MAQIQLKNTQAFGMIEYTGNFYIAVNLETPKPPFAVNGAPITPSDYGTFLSEADQTVELSSAHQIVDGDGVLFNQVVGGRPKCRKRN